LSNNKQKSLPHKEKHFYVRANQPDDFLRIIGGKKGMERATLLGMVTKKMVRDLYKKGC